MSSESSRMPGSADLDLHSYGERVFVTGGAGFVGSHLVRRLLELGHRVRVLVLPTDPAPLLAGLDVEIVRGDLSDEGALARAMEGCGLVFHLAAIYALWLAQPKRMYEVNVDGTRNVMRAAIAAGVRRVVHTSSIAAIGCLPGRALADERTGFTDWDVADGYVLSKYISEQEALRFDAHGLEVVAANPSFPFGPHDIGPTPTGRIIIALMKGQLPFLIDGGLNAVDVRDVAGHNLTNTDFYSLVSEITGTRPPRLRVPRGLLLRAGDVAEAAANRVFHKAPLLTRRSVAYTVDRYRWFSIDKAREELGYEPRPLRAAIQDAVDWFRAHSTS